MNVLERTPCGENDSGSDSLLLTCGKHATVHEAIIASAQLGGKVGMDIDLPKSSLLQQRANGL